MTSKEGTSLYALFTKFSSLLLTYFTSFLVSLSLTMMSYAVSRSVKPFKNNGCDSFSNVSSLASVVKSCSLICNASSCSLVIVFINSYHLVRNCPTLATKELLSYIATLCTSRDSVSSVVQMHTLYSSTSLTS